MRKRRRKKDGLLFRGVLGASFLLFWSGLIVLGLVSQAMNRDVQDLTRNVNQQAYDPSSDPEGFSLYAEFNQTDKTSVPSPADVQLKHWKAGDATGATVLSNGPDARRLVKDN